MTSEQRKNWLTLQEIVYGNGRYAEAESEARPSQAELKKAQEQREIEAKALDLRAGAAMRKNAGELTPEDIGP